MILNYTFEIVAVNEQARCMEVLYKATNYPDTLVGVRLPFVGENLLAVINMFSPASAWIEQQKEIVVPLIGTSGEINEHTLVDASQEQETESQISARNNAAMWEQVEFEKKVAAALIKFNVLTVDPTTIEVSNL